MILKLKFLMVFISVYFLIYVLLYLLVIHLIEVDVLFFTTLKIAILSAVILYAVVRYKSFNFVVDTYFTFSALLICLLLGYIVSISIPTVLDRSLSFYILQKLDQRKGVRVDGFEYIFSTEYIREHKLVDIRLTEQLNAGTVEIEDDCVRLTRKGKFLSDFATFYRSNLLPKKRLVLDRYTDELNNPFARSDVHPNYLCR